MNKALLLNDTVAGIVVRGKLVTLDFVIVIVTTGASIISMAPSPRPGTGGKIILHFQVTSKRQMTAIKLIELS